MFVLYSDLCSNCRWSGKRRDPLSENISRPKLKFFEEIGIELASDEAGLLQQVQPPPVAERECRPPAPSEVSSFVVLLQIDQKFGRKKARTA